MCIQVQSLYYLPSYYKCYSMFLLDLAKHNLFWIFILRLKYLRNEESLITSAINNEILFDNLSKLKLYIFKPDAHFKNITQNTGSAYEYFFVIDEGVNKNNVTKLRKRYVKTNQFNRLVY